MPAPDDQTRLTPAAPASAPGTEPGAHANTVARAPSAPAPTAATQAPAGSVGSATDVTRAPSEARAYAPPAARGLPDVPGLNVVRELARGGMGVVYLAHDPAFDRSVAVKVMHAGQDARRFVIESRVTARLPHPGVPPVYRLGKLPDGRPFLAMKLIGGSTLSDELKACDRDADLPRLLGAFERMCETVGFAHAQGIVHRDLKPANVMIGAFGEVLVMDWGLAKAKGLPTPDALPVPRGDAPAAGTGWEVVEETQAGAVKGTPAYMAPEQARGEPVDARADVFALGGILCAILTGKPPFAGETVMDTVIRAAQGDLDDTFARLDASAADPELLALAKRALAARAADRFADGKELADAVAAYRAGVDERLRAAERARAVSAAEAREQRKRRRVQVALVAAVALVALAGGAVAWYADTRARERERSAEQARRGASSAHALALDLVSQYKYAAARDALAQGEELAAAGAPDRAAELAALRTELELLVACDEARYRKWAAQSGIKDSDERLAGAAPAHRRAFAARGLDPSADPSAVEARIAASPLKAELVAVLDDWAAFNRDKEESRRLFALVRRLDPGPLSDRVRDRDLWNDKAAVARLAADPGTAALAPSVTCLLSFLMETNDLDPRPLLAAARARHPADFQLAFIDARARGLKGDESGMVAPLEAARALRPDNATAWNNLGAAHSAAGDAGAARAALAAAVARFPENASLRYNFGTLLRKSGDSRAAREHLEAAIRLDPNESRHYLEYGNALGELSDAAGAVAALRAAVRLNPDFGEAWNNLSDALRKGGDLPGATEAGARAAQLLPNAAEVHFSRGLLLLAQKRPADAAGAFREALRQRPGHAETLTNLGSALTESGDHEGALAEFQKALAANPKLGTIRVNIGLIKERRGDSTGAVAEFRAAVELEPGLFEAHKYLALALRATRDAGTEAALRAALAVNPKWADGHALVGELLFARGDARGAATAFRAAVALEPTAAGFNNVGSALSSSGDFRGAIPPLREAVRLDPKLADAHMNLGTAVAMSGDFKGAVGPLREAVRLNPKLRDAHEKLMAALRNSGDVRGSAEAAREALKAFPKSARFHELLGECLFLTGDTAGCIAPWQRAVELDPQLVRVQMNLARQFNNQKRFADVIPHARWAVRADPKVADAHVLLGMALANTGDLQGGRAALTEAARLEPKYQLVLNQLPKIGPEPAPPPRAK